MKCEFSNKMYNLRRDYGNNVFIKFNSPLIKDAEGKKFRRKMNILPNRGNSCFDIVSSNSVYEKPIFN